MARIRSIKPEFFTSETVAVLSVPARLTFIGMWTQADDAGRLVDNHRILKGAIWPLDDDVTPTDVSLHIHMLADVGLVERYEVEGKRYLHICGWREHQKINKPSTLKIPAPPSSTGDDEPSPTPPGALPETYRGERKGKEQGKDHQSRNTHAPLEHSRNTTMTDDDDVATQALRIAAPKIAARNGAAKPDAYARTILANGKADRLPELRALHQTHPEATPEALAELYLAGTDSAPINGHGAPLKIRCPHCQATNHTADTCPIKD